MSKLITSDPGHETKVYSKTVLRDCPSKPVPGHMVWGFGNSGVTCMLKVMITCKQSPTFSYLTYAPVSTQCSAPTQPGYQPMRIDVTHGGN